MTQTIRAATAADFLGLVPHMAGYTPRDSLVIVPFRTSRTAGLMRLDLPRSGIDLDAFAATVIGMVCRVGGADGLAVVVYSSDPWSDDRHRALFDALCARADEGGLRVVDALCVAADGWARHGDAPPRTLHPLREIPSPAVAGVTSSEGDQRTGIALTRADRGARTRMAAALSALDDALHAVCGDGEGDRGAIAGIDPAALGAVTALDRADELWEAALGWEWPATSDEPFDTTDPYPAAMLLWTLARPGLRDVALAQWCHGVSAGARALDDQLRWEAGHPYPAGPLFLAGEGPAPDPSRLSRARRVCVALAALAPDHHRAAVLAVAAWLSWALGLGTHAEAYAAAALDDDPGHGLAGIVRDLTAAGHLPAWAFLPPDDRIVDAFGRPAPHRE